MGYYMIKEEGHTLKKDGVLYQRGDKLPEDYPESLEPFVEYIETETEETETESEPESESESEEENLGVKEEFLNTGEMEEIEEGVLNDMLHFVGGGWYELPDGETVRGKEEAMESLAKKINEGEIIPEGDE